MQIEAKKLIDLPVAAMDTGSKVGQIQKIIIDPKNGNLAGFLVKTGNVFSALLALSIIDITDWDPNGLVTQSIDNLVPPREIIKINEISKSKFDLFELHAKTESGKHLGYIENFLLDTTTGSVTKYYLKDLISGEKIFSSDKVVRIDKNAIIFSDEVEEIPPDAASVAA